MQAAAIQACPQILDSDLNLGVKDNVVAMLVLQQVSADQSLMIKYVCDNTYIGIYIPSSVDHCWLLTGVIP